MNIKYILKSLWYNDRIFNLFMLLITLNFLILGNYALIYSHENSHKEIFEYFGCSAEIEVYFWSGYTTSYDCVLSQDDANALRIAQSNVEATYVDMTFYRFMIILMTMICVNLIKLKRLKFKGRWLLEKK